MSKRLKPIKEFTRAEIQALREKTREQAYNRAKEIIAAYPIEEQVMDRLQGKPVPNPIDSFRDFYKRISERGDP